MAEKYPTGKNRYNGGTGNGKGKKARIGIINLEHERAADGTVTYNCTICDKTGADKHGMRVHFMQHLVPGFRPTVKGVH